jgi:hypothetical protein
VHTGGPAVKAMPFTEDEDNEPDCGDPACVDCKGEKTRGKN